MDRTGLAVLAGGILLNEVSAGFGPAWTVVAVSTALALFGGAIGVGAWWRWRGNEEAMHALPRPVLVVWVAFALLALSLATAGLILLQ